MGDPARQAVSVLRIEHRVPDFGPWKAAFDSDPMGRAQAGVLRHRVLQATDDPNEVMIDLEFTTTAEAEAMLAGLRQLWSRVTGTLIHEPHAQITSVADNVEYGA